MNFPLPLSLPFFLSLSFESTPQNKVLAKVQLEINETNEKKRKALNESLALGDGSIPATGPKPKKLDDKLFRNLKSSAERVRERDKNIHVVNITSIGFVYTICACPVAYSITTYLLL
jgi:hypothetical protein